jgi:hypothetical protein
MRRVAGRVDVFVSYSHRDSTWLERLKVHLEPLVHTDRLRVWDDRSIQPGAQWLHELREAVARARVAVLLVSPDYLASPFIAREELPPLLRAAEADGLRIFWIPVRASIVDKTELATLQAAQPPDKPLASLRGPAVDRALANIARSICEVLEVANDASDTTFVEVGSAGGKVVALGGERATLGRAVGNDIALADDEVSRWHAVLERFGPHWYVRDLSSRNGTTVNGQRVGTERRLQPGDRIQIGRTPLVFHTNQPPLEADTTRASLAAPVLTAVERDVLVELARPLAAGHPAEPASDDDLARTLGLDVSDVQTILARLMEKFAVPDGPAQRTRLADEAVRRRAIDTTELRISSTPTV